MSSSGGDIGRERGQTKDKYTYLGERRGPGGKDYQPLEDLAQQLAGRYMSGAADQDYLGYGRRPQTASYPAAGGGTPQTRGTVGGNGGNMPVSNYASDSVPSPGRPQGDPLARSNYTADNLNPAYTPPEERLPPDAPGGDPGAGPTGAPATGAIPGYNPWTGAREDTGLFNPEQYGYQAPQGGLWGDWGQYGQTDPYDTETAGFWTGMRDQPMNGLDYNATGIADWMASGQNTGLENQTLGGYQGQASGALNQTEQQALGSFGQLGGLNQTEQQALGLYGQQATGAPTAGEQQTRGLYGDLGKRTDLGQQTAGGYGDLAGLRDKASQQYQSFYDKPQNQWDDQTWKDVLSYGSGGGGSPLEGEAADRYRGMTGYDAATQSAIGQAGQKTLAAQGQQARDEMARMRATRGVNAGGLAGAIGKTFRDQGAAQADQAVKNQIAIGDKALSEKYAGTQGLTNLAEIANQRKNLSLGLQNQFGNQMAQRQLAGTQGIAQQQQAGLQGLAQQDASEAQRRAAAASGMAQQDQSLRQAQQFGASGVAGLGGNQRQGMQAMAQGQAGLGAASRQGTQYGLAGMANQAQNIRQNQLNAANIYSNRSDATNARQQAAQAGRERYTQQQRAAQLGSLQGRTGMYQQQQQQQQALIDRLIQIFGMPREAYTEGAGTTGSFGAGASGMGG